MGVTLNKNGKPRKIGSGKTKAGCFAKIKWKNLKEFIKRMMISGRAGLAEIRWRTQPKKGSRKLSRSATPLPSKPKPPPSIPPAPKAPPRVSTKLEKHLPDQEKTDQDDYDPPPFCLGRGNQEILIKKAETELVQRISPSFSDGTSSSGS